MTVPTQFMVYVTSPINKYLRVLDTNLLDGDKVDILTDGCRWTVVLEVTFTFGLFIITGKSRSRERN